MKEPRIILITGATGGIGVALAAEYAAPGVTLILTGRNDTRLAALAEHCRGLGARVETRTLDISDHAALLEWLAAVDTEYPVDLVFVNAGISSSLGADGQGEPWSNIEQVIDINLTAALATAQGLVEGMRRRGSGQIVFVSSLSAYFGLPLTPAYCASKAALKSYAEAWRGWLADDGVGVTVVCPGFVKSDMSRGFPGPRPFLVPAQRAAQTIRRRLRGNPARVSFPFPLNFGMWGLGVLPPRLSLWILRRLGFSAPSHAARAGSPPDA